MAATSAKPGVAVYAVEPAAGNDGEQSFRTGRSVTIDPPNTIADGARTLAIGQRNFAIIRERIKDVVSVDDNVLLDTVKFAMYRTKLVIEPTGVLRGLGVTPTMVAVGATVSTVTLRAAEAGLVFPAVSVAVASTRTRPSRPATWRACSLGPSVSALTATGQVASASGPGQYRTSFSPRASIW